MCARLIQHLYSDAFEHTITSTYGQRGVDWLKQLPDLIAACAMQWNLTDITPYDHLTYNYVVSAMMNGKPVALKLRCDKQEMHKEAAAMCAFEQYGGVQLIAEHEGFGALLLERLVPGDALTTLFPHDDRHATEIAARLLQRLHQASMTQGFPLLHEVLPNLDKEPIQLAPFLKTARALREKLLAAPATAVFLHGDFHHGNILSDGDQWTVIDPEGIIGNPIYDLAVYIRNPLEQLIKQNNAQQIIKQRIEDFARLLDWDAQAIFEWTYLQAVSSAYWSIEDGLNVDKHVAFLKILDSMKSDKLYPDV